MNFLSLFTGIGGFDLGFESAGMNCIGQVENDPNCRKVLRRHWPDTERIEDVRSVTAESICRPDLICGGFPCQDLSVAGRRKGLAGERSGLWGEFRRIVAELRPAWVVVENVPGLFSSNERRDFAVLLRGLSECGYLVCYRVVDSQYFGVAQQRRRVFIVGSLGNGRSAEVLFERKSLSGCPAEGRKAGERPAGASEICASVSSKWAKGTGGPAGDEAYNLATHALQGPFGVRRLTPRECERLQGFPDDFTRWGVDENGKTVEISDTQRYRMLGNAITTTVALWIGERVVKT